MVQLIIKLADLLANQKSRRNQKYYPKGIYLFKRSYELNLLLVLQVSLKFLFLLRKYITLLFVQIFLILECMHLEYLIFVSYISLTQIQPGEFFYVIFIHSLFCELSRFMDQSIHYLFNLDYFLNNDACHLICLLSSHPENLLQNFQKFYKNDISLVT